MVQEEICEMVAKKQMAEQINEFLKDSRYCLYDGAIVDRARKEALDVKFRIGRQFNDWRKELKEQHWKEHKKWWHYELFDRINIDAKLRRILNNMVQPLSCESPNNHLRKIYLYNELTLAEIEFSESSIKIRNKEIYALMSKMAKELKFKRLIKCWDGAK